MSQWTDFVSKYYHDKKAGNPSYSFKQALKEAAPVFKKGGSGCSTGGCTAGGAASKSRRKSRKSRKMRKSRRHR